MATPTAPAGQDVSGQHPSASPAAEYDQFIETQIGRTRRQVKWVDLAAALMLLAAGAVVYLLLATLSDHWLVTGGLGFWGRLLACLGLVGGVLLFAAVRLWPLVVGRINPVYAAEAIERGRPGLKNSLVNFLLLRSRPEQVSSVVYQAVEQQAARGLSGVSIESAVDRSTLIRLGWALLIVVSVGMLYWAFSPKDVLQSVGRVILPWSDIEAPTSVLIRDVQPGNTQGFHDQRLTVSARVLGVAPGQPVRLRYTTAGRQVVDKELRMHLPEGGYRHQVELPAESEGLQEDIEYMILAGDARTPVYRVKVLTAPSIEVQSVEYEYPPYTELPPRKVERLGDVRALEGTKVTIHALASHPIKSAYLDFDCDGRRDLSMSVAENAPDSGSRAQRHASVSFTLALAPNTDQPVHDSYQLRFTNFDGHENSQPVRHSIDCIRDLAPQIALAEPQLDPKEPLDLPAGQVMPLTIVASDPDFKLADVRLQARRPNAKLADKLIFDEGLLSEPRAGQFRRNFVLNPGRYGLKPGDVVQFWAAALDNKQPQANRSETPRFTLRITSPDGQQKQQDQLAKADNQNQDRNDQRQPDADQRPNEQPKGRGQQNNDQTDHDEGQPDQDQPAEGQQQDAGKAKSGGRNQGNQARGAADDQQPEPDGQEQDAGGPQAGDGRQAKSDENRAGQPSDPPAADQPAGSDAESSRQETSQRVDPESDPGAAIERINNLLRQRGQPDDESAAGGADQQPPQRQEPAKEQPDPTPRPDSAAKESGQKQSGPEQTRQKQTSPEQTGQKPDADQKRHDSGQTPDAGQTAGEQQPGEKQAGQPQAANGQARKEQPGKEQPGKGSAAGGESAEGGSRPNAQDARHKKTSADDQKDGPGQSAKGGAGASDKPQATGSDTAQQNGQSGDRNQPAEGDKSAAGGAAGEKMKPGQGEEQATSSEQPREPGTPNAGQQKRDAAADDKQGEPSGAADEVPKGAEGQRKTQPGEGGQSKGAGEPDKGQKPNGKPQASEPRGGDPEPMDKGDGGAGSSEDNEKGSPSPQGTNAQREKTQDSPDADAHADSAEKPESPSGSEKQSDSQGGQAGDQSGGGNKGGGQRSNSPGVGSAGQNTAANQGGGQADQKGDGPTGTEGGDRAASKRQTGGRPNQQAGEGSRTRPGGDKAGGRPAKRGSDQRTPAEGQKPADRAGQPQDRPGEQRAEPAQPNRQRGPGAGQGQPGDGRGSAQDNPTQGGMPGDDTPPLPDKSQAPVPEGDEANLEYSRKATELALEHLKDQLAKEKPDQELLDELRWTRDDIQKFVERWEQLMREANEPGDDGKAARDRLDETLRSLGLRPRGTSLEGGRVRDDRGRNLRESRRSSAPPEYADQAREYQKGTARARPANDK